MVHPPLKSAAAALAMLLLALPLAAEDAPATDEAPVPETPLGAGATQPEAAPPGAALTADASSRCRQAVLRSGTDEGAWCDVLVNALNRRLNRTTAEDLQLMAAYHNRAVLAIARADLEAAGADLAAALALRPDHAGLHLARGNLNLAAGRFADALTDFDAAIDLSAAPPPGYFLNRALALRALGDIAGAAADARRATLPVAASAAQEPGAPPGIADPGAGRAAQTR